MLHGNTNPAHDMFENIKSDKVTKLNDGGISVIVHPRSEFL